MNEDALKSKRVGIILKSLHRTCFLTSNTSTLCKNTSKEVTTVFVVYNFNGVNLKLVSSSFTPLKILEHYLNYEKCKWSAFIMQCTQFNLAQST